MKRVYALGLLVLTLELWAYSVFRSHPLVRPDWFSSLLLVIQLLMCLTGIYAARWLLRKSPVAALDGPRRDWTKLWLWCGPVGGVSLVLACLLGKLATLSSGTLLAGLVVVAHLAAGAVVWTVALPWAVSDLLQDPNADSRERWLMQLGIVAQVAGFAAYFGFFPGRDVSPLSLVAVVFVFGFHLYYISVAAIVWSLIFRFWQPQPRSQEEVDSDRELDELLPPEFLRSESSEAPVDDGPDPAAS